MDIIYFNFTLVDRGGGSRHPYSLDPPLLAAIQTSVLQWLAFCRKGAKSGSEGGSKFKSEGTAPHPPADDAPVHRCSGIFREDDAMFHSLS